MKRSDNCLTFHLFEGFEDLWHASFLRHADETVRPYDSLDNLARERLGTTPLIWADECHGTGIIDVTKLTQPGEQGDALITNQPGIALMVHHADCQPALIYDPVQRVIAAVHSGWRGSVQNIYGKVIKTLRDRYHCKPENLLVGIGPSLGPTHAEFIHYRTELPQSFWKFQPKPNYFNFWAISEQQLTEAGVLLEHIEIARICTFANPSLCFSYRRDKSIGRHGTVIAMKN